MWCNVHMKRYIVPAILALFCFLTPVRAADFTADYDISYAISPTGLAIVTQNIVLTNNQSNLYPKQYTITIDTTDIKNVIAYDDKGVITPSITRKDGKTDIALKFNAQSAGLGKQTPFSLRFEQNDIAALYGRIWEVNIPGVVDDPNIGTYTVSLQSPVTFGANAYMKPAPALARKWTKEQMIKGGISAAYGEKQEYQAQLTYEMENTENNAVLYEIAIPPDTEYQKVTITSLDPKPLDLRRDEDGNWIAQYELKAGEKKTAVALLQISVSITPRSDFEARNFQKEEYLKPQPFWEVTDPKIVELAGKLRTPEAIYQFVMTTLAYDSNRTRQSLIRKGALGALKDPTTSVCSEFTDLFVAIARAAGIPAREVVGYAHTTNTKLRPISFVADVLHAWPEYYDDSSKLWKQVDPTWGNTTKGVNYFDTLDFDHIAFVIHGASSERPYPAGSFKEGSTPKKNVLVTFTEVKQNNPTAAVKTTFEIPPVVTLGYPLEGNAVIQNISGETIPELRISIRAEPFPVTIEKNAANVPPFGIVTVPVRIETKGFIPREKGKVTVTANGEIATFVFDMKPMYWLLIPVGSLLAGVSLIIWLFSKPK